MTTLVFTTSVFSPQTFTNRSIWAALMAVIILQILILQILVMQILVVQILVVQIDVLQGIFDTTSLSATQWGLAVLIGPSVLWVGEIRKDLRPGGGAARRSPLRSPLRLRSSKCPR